MKKGKDYRKTKRACYLGFVTQAIVANFTPLLFMAFHHEYKIPIASLALIPAVFYIIQLITDLLCAKFKNINYRKSIIISGITSATGLMGLAFLPELFPNPLVGILLCVCVYAIGSGLIEVLCSPIIEACPFPNKEGMMSLLHSFYCWGAVGVIVGSTLFFSLFGLDHWRFLACLWALIPLYNIINFATCPIEPIVPDAESMSMGQLLRNGMFWIFLLLMVAAGASEATMAQWTSAFAEASLGVEKAIGDLAGPCGFAFCMGLGRLWYSKKGQNLDLSAYMTWAGLLSLVAYLTASLASVPLLSLAGCMVSGLAVGRVPSVLHRHGYPTAVLLFLPFWPLPAMPAALLGHLLWGFVPILQATIYMVAFWPQHSSPLFWSYACSFFAEKAPGYNSSP